MAREAEICYSEQSIADTLAQAGDQADQRHARGLRHSLGNMLICLLCAFLTGINTLRGTAKWIKKPEIKTKLESYLDFEHGTPSASTFSRTLRAADNIVLQVQLADFFYQLVDHDPGEPEHLCFDGKVIRAAQSKAVTGYSLDIENMFNASFNLFLYQMRVGKKKQEGKEVEKEIYNLLMGYDSCVVTGDAMMTKKQIVDLICQGNCEAILPVKGNNKKLRDFLRDLIEDQIMTNPDDVSSTVDLGQYGNDDVASAFHTNTRVKIFEEDNRNVSLEDTYESNEEETTEIIGDEEVSPSSVESSENACLSGESAVAIESSENECVSEEDPSVIEPSENECASEEGPSAVEPSENECASDEGPSAVESSENTSKTGNKPSNMNAAASKPVEDFMFFDDVYNYHKVGFLNNRVIAPVLNPDNKQLEYFLIAGRWIPMFKTHGRFERREYSVLINQDTLAHAMLNPVFFGWNEIAQIGITTRYRAELCYDSDTKKQYYNISITRTPYILTKEHTVEEFGDYVKQHWDIETFHGVLDRVFCEDKSTIRCGSAPENCSLLRKLAFNLLTILNQKQSKAKDFSQAGYSELITELSNDHRTLFHLIFSRIRSPFK